MNGRSDMGAALCLGNLVLVACLGLVSAAAVASPPNSTEPSLPTPCVANVTTNITCLHSTSPTTRRCYGYSCRREPNIFDAIMGVIMIAIFFLIYKRQMKTQKIYDAVYAEVVNEVSDEIAKQVAYKIANPVPPSGVDTPNTSKLPASCKTGSSRL